jgi:hypothetical protein
VNIFIEGVVVFFHQTVIDLFSFLSRILENGDKFFFALVLLLFGWWIGHILENGIVRIGGKKFIAQITHKSGFPDLLKRAGIQKPPSLVIGQFVKGYIFTLFVLKASEVLMITPIAEFLQDVIEYIPMVVVALIIVLFGIRVAETTAAIIESGFRIVESRSGKILAIVAKGVIITFTILAALVQLKIATNLVYILFIGFVAMIALAGGLAFGLGGRRVVEEFLEDIHIASKDKKRNHFEEQKKSDIIERKKDK